MLNICQDFAKDHSMQFSTDPDPKKSKTKCLHFTLQERTVNPLKLNGDDLPWVKKALHLGNTLTTDISKTLLQMNTSSDLLQKRAIFFKNVHELKQAYGFYEPKIICEIMAQSKDMLRNHGNNNLLSQYSIFYGSIYS